MHTYRVDWYHRVPLHVRDILSRLQSEGRKAYIVGGAVRDLWLGLEPHDFDVVSEASTEEIERIFPKTIGVGKQFGIMVVVTEEGPVEVARFRADGAYTDNRHPDQVRFADPAADARRRDFTINALFYDPANEEVIDYVDGVEDLVNKKIQCVGEAHRRFEEDSLRMLRAIRFHCQLASRKFALDPQLIGSIRPLAPRLEHVSRERVTQEMERILLSVAPSVGLRDLISCGLWEYIFRCAPPASVVPAQIDELAEQHIEHFAKHPGLALPLAALEARVPGFRAEGAFVLSKSDKFMLRNVAGFRERLHSFDAVGLADKKLILGDPLFPIAWSVYRAADQEELPLLAREWEGMGRLHPPALLGAAELIALGIEKGPEIGRMLEAVRRAQLEESISSREDAEALVIRILGPVQ